MKVLRFLRWFVPVVSIVALGIAGWQLWQYEKVIEQWRVEAARLNTEIERLETQTQSDYYRGVLSACVGIGMQMSMPRELVATRCTSFMNSAYKADWYNELQIDPWPWPPKKE